MRKLSTHAEWLRLVEVSGPFLSMAMLERAFPQGLEAIDTPRRQRLRSAYEEWRDAVDQNDPQLTELHREWVRLVVEDILEYDQEVLVGREAIGQAYRCSAPECAVTFVPDLMVKTVGDEIPRLLLSIHPPETDLEKGQGNDGWPAPLVERMTLLCRTTGVRLGLVTNGERWMLVNAPVGSTSSHTSWYSRLWFQEPITLKAFLSLLGIRRCFGPADETLDALLEESLQHHEEVTDTLGGQVRRAVEVLVQCLDKADQDRNRELLHNVSPSELYEAGLTIMMRLVFVLCAEERGLLLLDDPVYDQNYSISTLRSQLADDADRHGPEILDRRHDAWARLLAVFRAIYGGIEHELLRMPALGGSLFDPDRFPFLEGRGKGTKWLETVAIPLPIDNRTVLLLLEALQLLEQPEGALLLSYKALDVENIGHVYEGLLEHTVARVPEVILGLVGSQNAKNPNVSLRELEAAQAIGDRALWTLLSEITKRGEPAIIKASNKPVDESLAGRVLTVCGGNADLARQILPFSNLLRTDAWGDPIVYQANSFMVTIGSNRRETGTHYTPKSLTENIVATTLAPITFIGPAEGKPREEWRLKSSIALLDLKVCDISMGSGAFLVQACRWLAEHVVEAWIAEEREGKAVTVDGEVVANLEGAEPMPTNLDDRLLIARRLVAERCLYGVDLNPLAVELAKLSIWLITMAKGRPFGFLDHNLRCGDSLLGIHRLDQLTELTITPGLSNTQMRIFGSNIRLAVQEAIELRQQLRKTAIRDIHDVEAMTELDCDARRKLEVPERIADALIGEVLNLNGNGPSLEAALSSLAFQGEQAVDGNVSSIKRLVDRSISTLSVDLPYGKTTRLPFHWPLKFPEVFCGTNSGFDAIIGNPPFKRGKDITGVVGSKYRDHLISIIARGVKGSADLVVYFMIRAHDLTKQKGTTGLITSKTISEGDSKIVGLCQLVANGADIYAAEKQINWPGEAQVVVSRIHLYSGKYNGTKTLDGEIVPYISEMLTAKTEWNPVELVNKPANAYQGVITHGDGFEVTPEEYAEIFTDDSYQSVVLPYLNGDDVNNRLDQTASRYAISFWDWPRSRDGEGSWVSMSDQERKKALSVGKVPIDYPGPVATDFEKAYSRVEKLVKPHRQVLKANGDFKLRKPLPQRWWQYADKRPGMYHEIGMGSVFASHPPNWVEPASLQNILVRVQTTKHHSFSLVSPRQIINNTINVIASEDMALFAILSSEIHASWFYKYGSNLGVTGKQSVGYPRYFHTAVFGTFPFCSLTKELYSLGETEITLRERIRARLDCGMTGFYNEVHRPDCQDEEIISFRKLLQSTEEAVASSYGWYDLDLSLGFYENEYLPKSDKIRFTFSAEIRSTILQRLEDLNKECYETEVASLDRNTDARAGTYQEELFEDV